MSLTHKQRGFTLIELLVVIAIIGILAATVIISLGSARNKAKDSQIKSDINSMMTSMEVYKTDNTTSIAASASNDFESLDTYKYNATTILNGSSVFDSKTLKHPDGSNDPTSGYVILASGSNSDYKIWGQLISDSKKYWVAANGTVQEVVLTGTQTKPGKDYVAGSTQ